MTSAPEPGWEPDFVVGEPDSAVDEELPEPGPPRRGARAVVVVAGLAVVGLVVGVVVSRSGGDARPSSRPTPTVGSSTAHSEPPAKGVRGGRSTGGGVRILHVPRIANPRTTCPEADDGSPACVVSENVPSGVVDAVHEQFPRAHVVSTFEEDVRDTGLGPGGLWFRRVKWNGHVSHGSIVVRQRVTGDHDITLTRQVRRGSLLSAEHVSGALTVEVTLVGDQLPRMRLARRAQVLARDPVVRAVRRM